MARSVLRAALAAAAVSSIAPICLAHGGSYRPPAGEVPPDTREPHDPPPPPPPGGPGTPGGQDPGGPTTGGGTNGDGPKTGGGTDGDPTTGGPSGNPPPSGGGTPGGANTRGGGRGKGGGVGFDDWRWWWACNQGELLALRGRIRSRRGPTSPLGPRTMGSQVHRLTDAVVTNDVIPLLREILATKDEHFDVRSAAALALAKIGDTTVAEDLRRLANSDGGDTHKVVVESAALALGLLEKDDAATRDCLLGIATDRDRKGSFARPFAAIALGFQTTPPAAQAAVRDGLLGVIAGKEAGEDAKPACLLGLGLSGDAGAVPALVQMVRTSKAPGNRGAALEDIDVAYALDALGRIGVAGDAAAGATAVLDLLVEQAADSGASPHVRRSAIVALGRVTASAPPKAADRALDLLVRSTDRSEDDAQVRNFALIALGRIGADPRIGDAARGRCIATLNRVLDTGKPANLVQPFAALGLALIGRAQTDSGAPVDDEGIRKPLRAKFAESRDPAAKSSFALASGLVRDRLAADALLAALSDTTTPSTLRSYAALSLGLIGDDRAVLPVRAALDEESDRELSLHAAIAAGLLGDVKAVDRMVALLRDPGQSQYVLGSVAIALGYVGDERAVEPLCAIVRDAKHWPDLTRALAVVALGRLGDRRDVPPLARLSTDFNYRAQTPATRELLTIL